MKRVQLAGVVNQQVESIAASAASGYAALRVAQLRLEGIIVTFVGSLSNPDSHPTPSHVPSGNELLL